MQMNIEDLMTIRRAAQYMGISTQRLYQVIKAGDIKPIEVSGVKMITRPQADRWISERKKTPVAA